MSNIHHLYRSRKNRVFAGICGGIAEYTGWDVTLVRLGLVIFSALPGPSVIFYVIAWIIMPLEPVRAHEHE